MGSRPHLVHLSSPICAKVLLLCLGLFCQIFVLRAQLADLQSTAPAATARKKACCAPAPPTARVGNRERRRWVNPRRVGWYFHLVIGEMAEPAKWSSRRAHWFFPRTSRPSSR